jgi:DNA-binding transcriptional regulator YiaG
METMQVLDNPTATHCCDQQAENRIATTDAPYRFVQSGLPNVFLVGIKYEVCKECGQQAAWIPAATELFDALARIIVSKVSPLTGPELRFLRKRLRIKAVKFAPMISLSPEYVSSLENNPDPIDPGRDKLVRIIYRAMTTDKTLKGVFGNSEDFQRWITAIHKGATGERIVASRLRNNHWKVESEPVAA